VQHEGFSMKGQLVKDCECSHAVCREGHAGTKAIGRARCALQASQRVDPPACRAPPPLPLVAVMMYGFGDDMAPLPDTLDLVEDIVVDYASTLLHKVCVWGGGGGGRAGRAACVWDHWLWGWDKQQATCR
jgi:hypothetical protein